ncbi:uncharacterized protein LOC144453427 [Glandiceps talaboti]
MNGKYGIVDEPLFDCNYDGGCENDGSCMSDGTCLCKQQYTGETCDQYEEWLEEDQESDDDGKSPTNTIIVGVIGIVIAVIAQCMCCVCLAVRHKKASRRRKRMSSNIVTLRTPDGREYQGYRPQWSKQFENVRRSDNTVPKSSTDRIRTTGHLNSSEARRHSGRRENENESTPSSSVSVSVSTTTMPVISISEVTEQGLIIQHNGRNHGVSPPPSYEEATSKYVTVEAPRTPPTH